MRKIKDLEKFKKRREQWRKHCEEISKKARLNEMRARKSQEYAKNHYSD